MPRRVRPRIVPPKSHSTTSPASMTRPVASWCGLAAFGPDADDGEVHAMVAFGDEPAADVLRHLGLGAADQRDVARLQLRGDAVGGRGRAAQHGDLGRVLHGAQRPHDLARLAGTSSRGSRACRSTRKRAHVRSPMAAAVPASRRASPRARPGRRSRPTARARTGRAARRPAAPRAAARPATRRRRGAAPASSAARAASPRSR